MAELKTIEVIMRIDFAVSDGKHVVTHSEKVQELIRCKDCKYCIEHYTYDFVPYWVCENWENVTDADGFCYEAERSENS